MCVPITAEQRRESECLSNATLFPSTYRLEWMDEPWADVDEAGEWLLRLANDFNPDVVHLNGYAHAALPWPCPVVVVAHSCVLSWWSAVKRADAPAEYAEYRQRVAAGLRAADAVIAPTAAMLETLRTNYEFFAPGAVIPNARDPHLFEPHEKRDNIFAAGRLWDEAKNFAALEAAAPSVTWLIEVAGDSKHPNGGDLHYEHVRSLGRLSSEQLAERLATSAIYALPARYEPFGLSALEAALSGCALVLGDIASLREVWGDAALFVPPDDPVALTDTLNALIADPAMRGDYAQRARSRAASFSPARMAESYRSAYSDCLASRTAEMTA